MIKGVIAIYDYELDYVYNLLDYLNRKKNFPLEVRVFTNGESLLEYNQKSRIDILLIGEDIPLSQVDGGNIGLRVLLSETRGGEDNGDMVVYKFQSVENLINQVLSYYIDQNKNNISEVIKTTSCTNIYGVFSCEGGTHKTTFSLALGQFLGELGPALYLNFEPISGLGIILNKGSQGGLSDLLYYVSQKRNNLHLKLRSMEEKLGKLNYLRPVDCFTELFHMEEGYLVDLVEQIKEHSNYQSIILDIGLMGNNTISLLNLCDKIYLTQSTSEFGISREHEFLDYLQQRAGEIFPKVVPIDVPKNITIVQGQCDMTQLCEGELREFIERLEGIE